jgi:hypothetical protein
MKIQHVGFAAILVCIYASLAAAHPGHKSLGDDHSVIHYVSSPLHWLPVIVGVMAVIAAWTLRLKLVRLPRTLEIRRLNGG